MADRIEVCFRKDSRRAGRKDEKALPTIGVLLVPSATTKSTRFSGGPRPGNSARSRTSFRTGDSKIAINQPLQKISTGH
jgi:hypothetical protein